MKKVRAAIVGYGNIGHYVLEALQAAPDFEIAGVVRRAGAENKPEELANYAVVKDIKELGDVDVAILCTPTRSVEKYAKEYLAMGINTVDKDKVLNYILVVANGKRTAKLNYKDIPDLRISKEQYEIVLEEFKNRRFIDYKGYDIEYLTLNFEIFNFAEKGDSLLKETYIY